MENVIVATPTQLESLIEKAVRKVFSETPPQYQNPPKKEKDVLNVDEAADLLNLAKQTVYSHTSKREIPHFKRGKKLYFKRAELLAWIDQSKRQTVAEMQTETDNYLSRNGKSSRKS
jgi:excisionase family DNA binding protein